MKAAGGVELAEVSKLPAGDAMGGWEERKGGDVTKGEEER